MGMDPLLRKKRKEILRILGSHGATNVRVFGSRARGGARGDSGVDILVDSLPVPGLWEAIGVKLELEDALGCPVDLIVERNLNQYRRDRILREAVPFEARTSKHVREDINHVVADMPDDWARLRDILDAARIVERYASAGEVAFQDDQMRQDAVVRRLEIIGEAVKKLSPPHRLEYPGVPWKKIAGERDVLIHDYPNVDLEEVWAVATRDVPVLRRQVEERLDRMERGREGLPPR